jgi:hypothetical protein
LGEVVLLYWLGGAEIYLFNWWWLVVWGFCSFSLSWLGAVLIALYLILMETEFHDCQKS